jgi:Ni/Co efflux regulator RcnB
MQPEPHPSQLLSLREFRLWVNRHVVVQLHRAKRESKREGEAMNKISKAVALTALAAFMSSGAVFAQDHHDNRNDNHHHYVHHSEWRKGQHIQPGDWNRGDHIDYRQYHLHAPQRGYEWREVDGNFVMAAVATGVIASVVVDSTIH